MSKPIKRWWLACGVAVLLMVLAIVWSRQPSRDDNPAPPRRQVTEGAISTQPKASPAALRWRVGSAQRYRLRIDASMRMTAATAGAVQVMQVRMACMLDLQTLEVDDRGALVGMRLSSVDLRINGDADPKTHTALSTPFRVRYALKGVPETFAFPADVDGLHRQMLENLVRTFQVTMEAGETWVAKESNGSGTFEAVYERETPRRVKKTKRHFHRLPSAPLLAGAEIVSTEQFQIDPQHDWLAAMTVDEILRSKNRDGLAMEMSNVAVLELLPGPHAVHPDTWGFAAAAAPPPAPEPTKPVPAISAQQARLEILDTLMELDLAAEGRIAWIRRLGELLRVDNSLPAMLLAEMKNQPLSDRTEADLYLALELAGTEPAQAALVSVIEGDGWTMRDAVRAVVALAGVDRPSPETVAALWETAETVAPGDERQPLVNTATLALGSLGGTLHAAKDPDYPLLRDRLLRGASGSAESDLEAEQRTAYVHAIGNTGDASLAGDVASFLEDDTPAVRRAAALSLGRLGTDQVAEALMVRLDLETSSQVRGAIAASLVNWTSPSTSAMATIRGTIRKEPDENTRYHMARFLAEHLAAYPENRPILQGLLRTERSKRIRQHVAESLATTSERHLAPK